MANTKVKITYVSSGPSVTVSPDPAQVKQSGRATWEIVQMPTGYTYKLDFSVQSEVKGPFPATGNANNPSRGVYVGVNGSYLTLINDQPVSTSWKYTIYILNAAGETVVTLDPAIEIVEN